MKQALLVIDMQTAWLASPRYDKDGVIARINQLSQYCRDTGTPVIFVRHIDADAPKNSQAWEVDSRLHKLTNDTYIDKQACDSFADTDLLAHLKREGIERLVICGLATEFCVDTTIRAALSHGFDLLVLADAHTTGDRPHLDAATIVQHHNWVWENIATPKDRQITVLSMEEFLRSMEKFEFA